MVRKSAPVLSAEQVSEVLRLIKGADSVELKLTVPDADRRSAVAALDMDVLDSQVRQVAFFDTPELTLNNHGVVVRARRVQGKPGDSVVKLRPIVPDDIPATVRKSPSFGIEVDAMPGGFVCSGSMKAKLDPAKVKEAFAGRRRTSKLFTIHDDEVARRYGFGGGLVPGVGVYAYMTRPAAEAWGFDWLEHGTMRARFLAPVYENDRLTVVPGDPLDRPTGPVVSLEVRNGAGDLCAVGVAGLLDPPGEPPEVTWPVAAPVDERPPASPAALVPGTSLGLPPHRFVAERSAYYLTEVREDLALYRDAGVAHPGWLLRDANTVLSANVVLGPWIHVESVVRHHGVVHDGDAVEARATVAREWENKGHRFVELDVGLIADERLVAHVCHTAIYKPRVERA